jgi:hypothetical protein
MPQFLEQLDLDLLDLEEPVVLFAQEVVDLSCRCRISSSAFRFTL